MTTVNGGEGKEPERRRVRGAEGEGRPSLSSGTGKGEVGERNGVVITGNPQSTLLLRHSDVCLSVGSFILSKPVTKNRATQPRPPAGVRWTGIEAASDLGNDRGTAIQEGGTEGRREGRPRERGKELLLRLREYARRSDCRKR
ncbi:hypothetical protein E2C01_028428 [Portunus trituberculatus]|uniref:Uncharacterized protein n=1 Tax=Portunus trituberculatus TaxID=210409 RepID=A0A5B7EKL6_PORTR|nr:hypothetical protein [Portunus trituberculatus]